MAAEILPLCSNRSAPAGPRIASAVIDRRYSVCHPRVTAEIRFIITMFRFIFRILAAKAAAKMIARMFGSNAARGATRGLPRR